MDFKINKFSHIFALLLVILTITIFIVVPILSSLGILSSIQIDQISNFPEEFKLISEIYFLILQIILVIVLFIIVPLFWYIIINKTTVKEAFYKMKFQIKNFDIAILWGIITMLVALVIIAIIGALLLYFDFDISQSSNIPELENYFSLPSIMVLIIFQPICEEIFFRGFLLEKIVDNIGEKTAILITALLFGLAHLSFGNFYPALLTGIIGILLAFIVLKTKNINSAIIAHILFNVISYIIYSYSKYV